MTVKEVVPDAVGVPEITPVEAARLNPAGKDPDEIDQLYGVFPPVAARVVEYELFNVPPGNDDVVIDGGCAVAATTMLKLFVAVLLFASFTCTVNEAVPDVVGVPEITPVEEARLNPAGNAPDVMLHV